MNLSAAITRIDPSSSAISDSRFRIPMNGSGTVEIARFHAEREEYLERIDFDRPMTGRVTIKMSVDGRDHDEVFAWSPPYGYGVVTLPVGLLVAPGSDVMVLVTTGSGHLSGATIITVALAAAKKVARDYFGLGEAFTPDELRRAYRAKAKTCHPDALGGSHEAMSACNALKDILDEDKR